MDAENYLPQAIKGISEAIDELKNISQNINSSSLKLIGLTAAITDIVQNANRISYILFELNHTNFQEEMEMDFPVQLSIFRILQAQIKNIIRHSNATAASIDLSNSGNIVQLSIQDNGKGFDKKSAAYGLGFQNIIHRAEQYYGSVEINTGPGKGCRLQVTLPLSPYN